MNDQIPPLKTRKQISSALQTPETLVNVISGSSGLVALATYDLDGFLTYASQRWCELTGWSSSEVTEFNLTRVVHPEDMAKVLLAQHESENTFRPCGFEARFMWRGGDHSVWTRSQISPLVNDNEIFGWLVGSVDITDHKVVEESLTRNERRLRAIFDSSSDIVTILEPDGTWRSTSKSGSRLLEYPEGAPPKGDIRSIVHPEDIQIAVAAFNEIREGRAQGLGNRWELRVISSTGKLIWLETVGVNLIYDPAVRGIVLHSRDVTERHEAAEKLSSMASRLASLVDNLTIGVLLADETEHVLFANTAFLNLFQLGGKPKDLIGWHERALHVERLLYIISEPDKHIKRLDEVIARDEAVIGENIQLRDGRTLARSAIPISVHGHAYGRLWLYEDLSDQIAVAKEREYLLEMETKQNARLKELDILKSELVSSVSHELRTPLTSIMSFTQILRDGLESDSVSEQREFLDIVQRNSERLLLLVNDLLLLDRLESNSFTLQPESVDIPGIIEIAAQSMRPLTEEKNITLTLRLETGPSIIGDVERVGQLVDNLISNSIKFTRTGGEIVVEAEPSEGGWQITVTDNGIGIPPDELPSLFQRFFRASNAQKQAISGSGLGLTIALRIAEMHQGTIEVSSEEGKGTRFIVTLFDLVDPSLPISPLSTGIS